MDTKLALRMIAQMNNDELNEAVAQIKRRRKLLTVQALCTIQLGTRVSFFDPRENVTRDGIVTKIGRTKLTVRESRADLTICNWSVPPTMCTVVAFVEPQP